MFFPGSHSECEVICRRVLQRFKLADIEISESRLRQLYCTLTGASDTGNDDFDREFLETESLKRGRLQYPHAFFLIVNLLKMSILTQLHIKDRSTENDMLPLSKIRLRFLIKFNSSSN